MSWIFDFYKIAGCSLPYFNVYLSWCIPINSHCFARSRTADDADFLKHSEHELTVTAYLLYLPSRCMQVYFLQIFCSMLYGADTAP